MNTPSISASMHDASRTRENEGPSICDTCPLLNLPECDGDCGKCEGALAEEAADEWREAVRDEA